MSHVKSVGVIGASSLIGQFLLPLLRKEGFKVFAFSRRPHLNESNDVVWRSPSASGDIAEINDISYWISLAPIWVLPEFFEMIGASDAKRVVVLSSTSRFTKKDSPVLEERELVQCFIKAEDQLQGWAEEKRIDWVILRPTLIYGGGRDKNISEIMRIIRRFRFFPILGDAKGLRQPVHAQDIAWACFAALSAPAAANHSYNLSGGETLTYKQMVERVFQASGCGPIFVKLPIAMLRVAVTLLRFIPRYRNWTSAMFERMNHDLAFDHSEAQRDLNFNPRRFELSASDLISG
ncbi:NAD-dependent epimerase/dehydratase family protein [Methylomonas sp. MgM2]